MRHWLLLCALAPFAAYAADTAIEPCQSDTPALIAPDDMTVAEQSGVAVLRATLLGSLDLLTPEATVTAAVLDGTRSGMYADIVHMSGERDTYVIFVGRALFAHDLGTIARVAAGYACNISLGYAVEKAPDEGTALARRTIVRGCVDRVLEDLTAPPVAPEPEQKPELEQKLDGVRT